LFLDKTISSTLDNKKEKQEKLWKLCDRC